jgi:hypothetical protein
MTIIPINILKLIDLCPDKSELPTLRTTALRLIEGGCSLEDCEKLFELILTPTFGEKFVHVVSREATRQKLKGDDIFANFRDFVTRGTHPVLSIKLEAVFNALDLIGHSAIHEIIGSLYAEIIMINKLFLTPTA